MLDHGTILHAFDLPFPPGGLCGGWEVFGIIQFSRAASHRRWRAAVVMVAQAFTRIIGGPKAKTACQETVKDQHLEELSGL